MHWTSFDLLGNAAQVHDVACYEVYRDSGLNICGSTMIGLFFIPGERSGRRDFDEPSDTDAGTTTGRFRSLGHIKPLVLRRYAVFIISGDARIYPIVPIQRPYAPLGRALACANARCS